MPSSRKETRLILESQLTPEEKIEMWMNGDREENIKACGPDKLRQYYKICKDKDFKRGMAEIEKVAASKNVKLEKDEDVNERMEIRKLYNRIMENVGKRVRQVLNESDDIDDDFIDDDDLIIDSPAPRRYTKLKSPLPPVSFSDKTDLRRYIRETCNKYGWDIDLNHIDVSEIEDMSFLCNDFDEFNCDISQWDVSNVRSMRSMFICCTKFNNDISAWDVSNVNNMTSMFMGCRSFNQDLDAWDVSNVRSMANMFQYCDAFDQPLGSWDVSKCEDMHGMFNDCKSFNQPLAHWDVSRVYDFSHMFYKSPYNQDLSTWRINRHSDTSNMFDRYMDEENRPRLR